MINLIIAATLASIVLTFIVKLAFRRNQDIGTETAADRTVRGRIVLQVR